jgi:mercuric ion transport protein
MREDVAGEGYTDVTDSDAAETASDHFVALGAPTGGLGGALASVLAALCCIGPSAVALLGAGGAAAAASLAPYRPLFLIGSLAVIAFGFWRVYDRRPVAAGGAACPVRVGRFTRSMLWVAAAVWLVAAVLPSSWVHLPEDRMTIRSVLQTALALIAMAGCQPGGEDRPHVTLGNDAEALRAAFNADSGRVRVVMLVAPTW